MNLWSHRAQQSLATEGEEKAQAMGPAFLGFDSLSDAYKTVWQGKWPSPSLSVHIRKQK